MTFDVRQEAIEIIGETELYAFDFGDFVEHYTSERRPVDAFGETWLPLPINREVVDSKKIVRADEMRLVMPCQPAFVDIIATTGLDAIGVTIWRGFGRNYAEDFVVWFVGHLTEINVDPPVVQGRLKGTESILEAVIPRIVYQAGCNQILYSQHVHGCQVNRAEREETRTVTAIAADGRIVSVGGMIQPNDWFTLGRMRRVGSSRDVEVLQQAGNDFVLHLPIARLEVGDQVVVAPGCMKRVEVDCTVKFNNKPRNLSMALIPNTNPIVDGF